MSQDNPYLDQCREALPRLLALFDTDPHSATRGLGDRYRWAWKLTDFGNGTYQGAAHGLARLMVHRFLPDGMTEGAVLRRIDAMFDGVDRLRDRNGSLAEAFPHESSFCVTALAAHDLLSAVELLLPHISRERRQRFFGVVQPMIEFLHHADETHGFISNHLAAAATALYRWTALTGEPGEDRGRKLIAKILAGQSDEGWFREYEGADPGYQSYSTYYLADLHHLRPDISLLEPLRKSVRFLWRFAHPDGSFGGHYGSRNTRFYCPAGLELLSGEIPEAAVLAAFMRKSITAKTTVTLSAMDDSGMVPMFNAYASAAASYHDSGQTSPELTLPALSTTPWKEHLPDAGLLLVRGKNHYTILSTHKGGVCYHYPAGGRPVIDAGVVAKSAEGKLYSTQAFQPGNAVDLQDDIVVVKSGLTAMQQRLPTPVDFIVLRFLNVTVMRCSVMRDWVKKALVRLLITGKSPALAFNRRTIRWSPEFSIVDEWEGDAEGLARVKDPGVFSAIHMASQGYWQRQDDEGP